jgi:hypothetical protein
MKKAILHINLVLFVFLLFSCSKENTSSTPLSESEAYYKNKIATFLTLTDNPVSEKEVTTVIHVSFNSYREEYEYFKFLDPGPFSDTADKTIKSSSGNKLTATVEPSGVPPMQTDGLPIYDEDPEFPESPVTGTYDGVLTFNAPMKSSLNPGNIGVSAHIRFTYEWSDPSLGGFATLVQNRVISSGVFFGGAGTMTKNLVVVTPSGGGGVVSGQVQYVITYKNSPSLSGYVTLQGTYTFVQPPGPDEVVCLVNYSMTAIGNL